MNATHAVQRKAAPKVKVAAPKGASTFGVVPLIDPLVPKACACGGGCPRCQRTSDPPTPPEATRQQPIFLQAKLAVGATDDPLEREADRVAEQVVAASAPHAVGGAPLRIQRFTGQSTGQTDTAPASVDRVLASSGRPLEPALRQDMGQRFGHDFSNVRVHTDAKAAESARAVSARAYTVGHDIIFAEGQYDPGVEEGRKLLAHELTHTIQQSAFAPAAGPPHQPISIEPPGTSLEQAAVEHSTRLTNSSGALAPIHRIALQRQPAPPPAEIEMPAEFAFEADERKRTWRMYARSMGRKDAARIRESGKLSSEDREEVTAKLRFFEGDAWKVYVQEIKPALAEVTREEIEMPAEDAVSITGSGQMRSAPESEKKQEPVAESDKAIERLVQSAIEEAEGDARGKVLLSIIVSTRSRGRMKRWALELQRRRQSPYGNYLNLFFVKLSEYSSKISEGLQKILVEEGIAVSPSSGEFQGLEYIDHRVQAPVNPELAKASPEQWVDSFDTVIYDLSYKPRRPGVLSEQLQVSYADGTKIDVDMWNISDNLDPAWKNAIARSYIGSGRRIFPIRMSRNTTPRLWAEKQKALGKMEESNQEFETFVAIALAGVMSNLPIGPVVGRAAPLTTTLRAGGTRATLPTGAPKVTPPTTTTPKVTPPTTAPKIAPPTTTPRVTPPTATPKVTPPSATAPKVTPPTTIGTKVELPAGGLTQLKNGGLVFSKIVRGQTEATAMFGLEKGKLTAGILNIKTPVGANPWDSVKAFMSFKNGSMELARQLRANTLRMEGNIVLNPKVEGLLRKQGFVEYSPGNFFIELPVL